MNDLSSLLTKIYGVDLNLLGGSRIHFGLPEKGMPDNGLTDISLLASRMHHISFSVVHTLCQNVLPVEAAVYLLTTWMQSGAVVRILGAGRALLAGSMPGNRLAHAGVKVSYMGGIVPLPNSIEGGGIISCSASGKTATVLQAMEVAKRNNPEIQTLGIAAHNATQFASLCDVFIGIQTPPSDYPNPLSALADVEEYIISEILDGLVVLAGKKIGFDDLAWRQGHEDIGPTGPYAPDATK